VATFPLDRAPPRAQSVARDRDLVAWWVGAAAAVASIVALLIVDHAGQLLAYFDATSHMVISRKVLDNSSGAVSLAQLGGVWLPLPHLLALPFVWNDDLYYSGLAGSFSSMAAYVAACVYLYKLVEDLTGSRLGGVVTALAFGANPNVLYMQAVPMTELLLCAAIAALAYYLQRWVKTDRWGYLLAAGIAADVGCATRYEAWVVMAASVVVVAIVLRAKRVPWRRAQDLTLAFALFACVSVGLWLLWNQLIFDNALNFQIGEYAKPSNWVGSGDVAVGNPGIAARTYGIAIADIAGPAVIALGVVGLVLALVRRETRLALLPTLASVVLVPFFVVALERGQRPMHVAQITGDLYNIRFALTVMIPLAIGAGCLVALGRRLAPVVAAVVLAAVVVTGLLQLKAEPVLAREPNAFHESKENDAWTAAAGFLRTHAASGRVLAGFFGNEPVLFGARVNPGRNIDEGSFLEWDAALKHPAAHQVRWIVMRQDDHSDPVFDRLSVSPELTRDYRLVYDHLTYRIYERR
jgi:hypothetical protein